MDSDNSPLLPRLEFAELASKNDVVNLGQGFPNFPPPDFVLEAFQHAISGDFMLNQYTMGFVSLPAQCWTVVRGGTHSVWALSPTSQSWAQNRPGSKHCQEPTLPQAYCWKLLELPRCS